MKESGIVILVNELHEENAELSIVSQFSPSVTVDNLVHEENADDLIDVTECGIVILFNELHEKETSDKN